MDLIQKLRGFMEESRQLFNANSKASNMRARDDVICRRTKFIVENMEQLKKLKLKGHELELINHIKQLIDMLPKEQHGCVSCICYINQYSSSCTCCSYYEECVQGIKVSNKNCGQLECMYIEKKKQLYRRIS